MGVIYRCGSEQRRRRVLDAGCKYNGIDFKAVLRKATADFRKEDDGLE